MWWITSTTNAGRQCSPIKKSGGTILTSLKCIRPVCQASDLAAAEDGLWLQRNKAKLSAYWGPDQYGGLYEAQGPVVVITLLGQTRAHEQLPFIANFADEQFGFDVCPREDIRVGTYKAGVCGGD